jgi:purine-nucleoside phosphorylase
MATVVAPVRMMATLGVEVVVFTNAAGAIRPDLSPGDIVLLDDHLNLMFRSPLAGAVSAGEDRFPDMSAPYDRGLQDLALGVATRAGASLARGCYAAVLGPTYETAAEVRMLRSLGADVVGMSTVPEVITARASGVRCVAFSVVTNFATGLAAEALSHDEVLGVGRDAGRRMSGLLADFVAEALATLQSTGTK